MGRKKKALRDPVDARPSKVAKEVAKVMLAPAETMKGLAAQVEMMTAKCEEMHATLEMLVVAVREKGLIVEPAPSPKERLLTEPAPTPNMRPPLTE